MLTINEVMLNLKYFLWYHLTDNDTFFEMFVECMLLNSIFMLYLFLLLSFLCIAVKSKFVPNANK